LASLFAGLADRLFGLLLDALHIAPLTLSVPPADISGTFLLFWLLLLAQNATVYYWWLRKDTRLSRIVLAATTLLQLVCVCLTISWPLFTT
jgi:hypothetical protein